MVSRSAALKAGPVTPSISPIALQEPGILCAPRVGRKSLGPGLARVIAALQPQPTPDGQSHWAVTSSVRGEISFPPHPTPGDAWGFAVSKIKEADDHARYDTPTPCSARSIAVCGSSLCSESEGGGSSGRRQGV